MSDLRALLADSEALESAEARVATLREALREGLVAIDHAAKVHGGDGSFLGYVLIGDKVRYALRESASEALAAALKELKP